MIATLRAAIWAAAILAQVASPRADSLIGEVAAADASSRQLTLKADDGRAVAVSIAEGASLLRAKPGARSLSDAGAVSLGEIAVGDRVLVRGARSEDGASFTARQVVVMARDDIARKQEAERADWRRRGVLGTVTAVDAGSGGITLQVGRAAFARTLSLPTAGRTITFRRYAPDSVKFSDARPSALGEVKVGDELRALGERSADEKTFLAEQVVFGSFQLVAGSVTSVEAAKNEVALRDDSGRKVIVSVSPDARLRRLPPEMAARFAQRRNGVAASSRGAAPPRSEGGAERPRWGRDPGGSGGEDILDRMPATTLAELKAGDRVLVSSTKGGDPARMNAIALVAGLEALPPLPSAPRAARGPESSLPPELLDMGLSLP